MMQARPLRKLDGLSGETPGFADRPHGRGAFVGELCRACERAAPPAFRVCRAATHVKQTFVCAAHTRAARHRGAVAQWNQPRPCSRHSAWLPMNHHTAVAITIMSRISVASAGQCFGRRCGCSSGGAVTRKCRRVEGQANSEDRSGAGGAIHGDAAAQQIYQPLGYAQA